MPRFDQTRPKAPSRDFPHTLPTTRRPLCFPAQEADTRHLLPSCAFCACKAAGQTTFRAHAFFHHKHDHPGYKCALVARRILYTMSAFTDEATPILDGYHARAQSAQSHKDAVQQLAAMGFTDTTHTNHLLAVYNGSVERVLDYLLNNSMPVPIAPTSTAAPAEDSEAGVAYSAEDLADLFGSARFMRD